MSIRHRTVVHKWDFLVSRMEKWGQEYLQVDEWKMQMEEEQVVLSHFNNVSILNLVPFPRLEYKLSGLHREKCHWHLHSIYSPPLLLACP